jgi:hypothetical protein
VNGFNLHGAAVGDDDREGTTKAPRPWAQVTLNQGRLVAGARYQGERFGVVGQNEGSIGLERQFGAHPIVAFGWPVTKAARHSAGK